MHFSLGANQEAAPANSGGWLARGARRLSARSRSERDMLALFAIGGAALIGEYYGDLAPKLFALAISYRAWGADELVLVALTMSLGLLIFSYRRVRELTGEIQARRRAERQAAALARHDPLTGLLNRRGFAERLREAVTAATPAAPAAVLMLNLDGFRLVNDAYGHTVGDQLVVAFAQRVLALLRGGAQLARLDGDAFAVVAPAADDLNPPAALARQIVAATTQPFVIGAVSALLGVGVGIALAPTDAAQPEALAQRAERALARAKAEGRSRISFFEPEMDALVDRRVALEIELRAAIAARRIAPFYQPIVRLKDAEIVGFEALARWNNARGEWVSPDLFIPLAEELGLIGELGDQLLRKSCLDARDWPGGLTLAFNVSGRQLRDPTLGLRIISILAETGFSPRRLEIEITETAAVDNIHVVQAVIADLRQAGVRIALDDFGTGYSTFAQLLALKPDRIKIDRSFVDKLGEDKDRATIVRALLGLASGFNLATTAEGVENDRQCASLTADGCLEGQGYLFSKAVPAAEVGALIESGMAAGRTAA